MAQKWYAVDWIETGVSEVISRAQGNRTHGRVEFKEMIDGYLPNVVVTELDPEVCEFQDDMQRITEQKRMEAEHGRT